MKDVSIELRDVTVVIGGTNTGKSNLIESISLLDVFWKNQRKLREMVRMENMRNLFTDEFIDRGISIEVNGGEMKVDTDLTFIDGVFKSHLRVYQGDNKIADRRADFAIDGSSRGSIAQGLSNPSVDRVRFYKYKDLHSYPNNSLASLVHPFGDNLFRVTYASKDLRGYAKTFLDTFNFSLVFRPQSNTFEIQKQVDDILVNLPYTTLSDTIKQVIFYSIAVLSNKGKIILFEGPGGHSFPYYTKYLAQLIADNLDNQYVLVTHSPYFLRTLIEKVPKERINILVANRVGFNTSFHEMTDDQLSEILDSDPFFNLHRFSHSL